MTISATPAYIVDGVEVSEEQLRDYLDQRQAEQLAAVDADAEAAAAAVKLPDPTGSTDATGGATPDTAPTHDPLEADELGELANRWPGLRIGMDDRGFVAFDPGTNHTFIEESPAVLHKTLEAVYPF